MKQIPLRAGVKLASVCTHPTSDGEQTYFQCTVETTSWSCCKEIELFEINGQGAPVLWAKVTKEHRVKHPDKRDTVSHSIITVNMAFVDVAEILDPEKDIEVIG